MDIAQGFGTYPSSQVALANGDFSATDPAPVEFGTTGAVALTAIINVSAISGAGATVTVSIDIFDPGSGSWVQTVTPVAITALGRTTIVVDPRGSSVTNKAQLPLAQKMRVTFTRSGTTTTLSYSCSLTLSN